MSMARVLEDILGDLLGTLLDIRNQLAKHHAQDVALYEHHLAIAERCCDYSGRQTLVAEHILEVMLGILLQGHTHSRTPQTEG
jgi:hypothetical protein